LRKYARQNALPVENDFDRLLEMGLKVVGRRLLQQSAKVRHDPPAIAAVALELAAEGRRRATSGPSCRPRAVCETP
jgi:hypothetical protein